MAVSSLSKMTVPLASDQSASTQGLLMPKLKYRFRVMFENFGSPGEPVTELTKQVIDFKRPTVTFEQIDLPIYNSTIKLAGKHSWDDVTVNLRDDAGANVQNLVGEQLQKQLDFMEMASAASGIDYKFLTRFEVLDGGNGTAQPIALETWEIPGIQDVLELQALQVLPEIQVAQEPLERQEILERQEPLEIQEPLALLALRERLVLLETLEPSEPLEPQETQEP